MLSIAVVTRLRCYETPSRQVMSKDPPKSETATCYSSKIHERHQAPENLNLKHACWELCENPAQHVATARTTIYTGGDERPADYVQARKASGKRSTPWDSPVFGHMSPGSTPDCSKEMARHIMHVFQGTNCNCNGQGQRCPHEPSQKEDAYCDGTHEHRHE